MNNNWFLCAVTYIKTLENGTQKKVAEKYLTTALTCTEAEAKVIEEVTPFIDGEFEVSAVAKEDISEIFYDEEGDNWFKAKIAFITLDEKSGREKKTKVTKYAQAVDLQGAVKNIETGMKGTLSDWEISSISETNIISVI